MSVDWFLFSPSHNKEVMVGSVGLSGVQSFPAAHSVVDFIRWAIEENVSDIVLLNEDRLFVLQDDAEKGDK